MFEKILKEAYRWDDKYMQRGLVNIFNTIEML